MARHLLPTHGVTVDLSCPQCGTLFTVAASLVLDGGTAWCPGCRAVVCGDDRPRAGVERLRRGHLAALRRALRNDHDRAGRANGAQGSAAPEC